MVQHSERRLQHIASSEVDGSTYTDFAHDNTFATRPEDRQTNSAEVDCTEEVASDSLQQRYEVASASTHRNATAVRKKLIDGAMPTHSEQPFPRSRSEGGRYRRNRRELPSTAELLDVPKHTDDIDEPPQEIKYRSEWITPRIYSRRNDKFIMNCSIDCHSCSLIFLDYNCSDSLI